MCVGKGGGGVGCVSMCVCVSGWVGAAARSIVERAGAACALCAGCALPGSDGEAFACLWRAALCLGSPLWCHAHVTTLQSVHTDGTGSSRASTHEQPGSPFVSSTQFPLCWPPRLAHHITGDPGGQDLSPGGRQLHRLGAVVAAAGGWGKGGARRPVSAASATLCPRPGHRQNWRRRRRRVWKRRCAARRAGPHLL